MELIRLTEPVKIELLREGRWTESWSKDILLEIKENGEIYVSAEESELSKIRFQYKLPEDMQNTYLYGDAWERGYGNLKWSRNNNGRIMPWYCLMTDLKTVCGYGVKVLPNALCFWTCEESSLLLTFDIRNGTEGLHLSGEKLRLAVLVAQKYGNSVVEDINNGQIGDQMAVSGLIHHAAGAFCRLMCDKPRKLKYPVYGGNDWYCNYGNSSYDKIIRHTEKIVECAQQKDNRPYMVIDAGWQKNFEKGNCGPWEPNEKFGDMKKLAEDIVKCGALPGIWIRPLLTGEEIKEHNILRRDGACNVLDPSGEENLKRIQADIRKIVNWGYRFIKLDFLTFDICGKWGFSMGDEPFEGRVIFKDKTKTTAQIIKKLYRALRSSAGEDIVLLGCNTMSHLSAGIFDIQRTGDDTSGTDWELTKKMGINTLAFRMMQHQAFYAADADCVGITKLIPWECNRKWLDVLAKSGTPLFVSIAEDAWSENVKKDLQDAFKKAAVVHNPSIPIDCLEKQLPQKWVSDFGVDRYQWDE